MKPQLIHQFEHDGCKYVYLAYKSVGDTTIIAVRDNSPVFKIIVSPMQMQTIEDMELEKPIESGLTEFCKGFDSILIHYRS